MAVRGTSSYKILDNSLNELGVSVNLDKLAEAAEVILPNEIVIPDAIDPDEARVVTQRALHDIYSTGKYWRLRELNKMAVVHATSMYSYLEQMEQFAEDSRVDVIGIPKVVAKMFGPGFSSWNRGRALLMAAYISRGNSKPVHFLGYAGFNEFDGIEYITRSIRTMDSRLMLGSKDLYNRDDILSHADLREREIPDVAEEIKRVREVYEFYGLC